MWYIYSQYDPEMKSFVSRLNLTRQFARPDKIILFWRCRDSSETDPTKQRLFGEWNPEILQIFWNKTTEAIDDNWTVGCILRWFALAKLIDQPLPPRFNVGISQRQSHRLQHWNWGGGVKHIKKLNFLFIAQAKMPRVSLAKPVGSVFGLSHTKTWFSP